MSRAFINIDETCPNLPVPELTINGQVFRMSERELQALVEDAQWALGCIRGVRLGHWQNLARRYSNAG